MYHSIYTRHSLCSIFLKDKHAKYAVTCIKTFGSFSDLIKLVKSMKRVDRGVLVLSKETYPTHIRRRRKVSCHYYFVMFGFRLEAYLHPIKHIIILLLKIWINKSPSFMRFDILLNL